MKFLTIILATTVLFLSLKPGIDVLSLQKDTSQSCCSKCISVVDTNPSHNEKQKKSNDEKSCNPFQICSSCVLISLTGSSVDNLQNPKISTIQIFSYQSFFSTQFISDFWQPPKIA